MTMVMEARQISLFRAIGPIDWSTHPRAHLLPFWSPGTARRGASIRRERSG